MSTVNQEDGMPGPHDCQRIPLISYHEAEMLNLPTSRLPQVTKEGSLVAFLARSGRKVRHAIADGNCMFRSLSINLYGHQDEHLAIRKLLVNFEELNNKQFAQYLAASDETTIDDHISNMTRPFVWGTQIELFAITSFFSNSTLLL